MQEHHQRQQSALQRKYEAARQDCEGLEIQLTDALSQAAEERERATRTRARVHRGVSREEHEQVLAERDSVMLELQELRRQATLWYDCLGREKANESGHLKSLQQAQAEAGDAMNELRRQQAENKALTNELRLERDERKVLEDKLVSAEKQLKYANTLIKVSTKKHKEEMEEVNRSHADALRVLQHQLNELGKHR